MNELLRALPRVDDILDCVNDDMPRTVLVECIREILDNCRSEIINGQCHVSSDAKLKGNHESVPFFCKSDIVEKVITLAKSKLTPTLRPVINATGIVLHTNLGRAPMAESVAEHVKQVAMGYSTLEYNIDTGKRGSRTAGIENLLVDLTNAEAACIVNNNAAAVLLVLSALCNKGEVVVSRGELVEIGGSFRVPEVISQGGAILKEVGSTNKTHLSDYNRAINQETSALLKVHTSNYKIMGFTEEVSMNELANLAKEANILSIYDLGSGSFVSFAGEPTVQQAIVDGVDVLCFSGDKLLGGPQCGIILGKEEYIAKLRAHPLYRALRADKLTLAALEASLKFYLDLENAKVQIPTLSMLLAPVDELKEKATRLLELLNKKFAPKLQKTMGQAGGGSLPLQEFESYTVAINQGADFTIEELEKRLRCWRTPIISRIHKDTLLLDVRTIEECYFTEIAECLNQS